MKKREIQKRERHKEKRQCIKYGTNENLQIVQGTVLTVLW